MVSALGFPLSNKCEQVWREMSDANRSEAILHKGDIASTTGLTKGNIENLRRGSNSLARALVVFVPEPASIADRWIRRRA